MTMLRRLWTSLREWAWPSPPPSVRCDFDTLALARRRLGRRAGDGNGREGRMSEFKPVETQADLATLDPDEIVDGYRDGLRGAPEPGNNRSRAYWHGWRNGMVDSRRREGDAAQARLAHEFVQNGGFARIFGGLQ